MRYMYTPSPTTIASPGFLSCETSQSLLVGLLPNKRLIDNYNLQSMSTSSNGAGTAIQNPDHVLKTLTYHVPRIIINDVVLSVSKIIQIQTLQFN